MSVPCRLRRTWVLLTTIPLMEPRLTLPWGSKSGAVQEQRSQKSQPAELRFSQTRHRSKARYYLTKHCAQKDKTNKANMLRGKSASARHLYIVTTYLNSASTASAQLSFPVRSPQSNLQIPSPFCASICRTSPVLRCG